MIETVLDAINSSSGWAFSIFVLLLMLVAFITGRIVSRQTIQDVTKEVMARWHGKREDD